MNALAGGASVHLPVSEISEPLGSPRWLGRYELIRPLGVGASGQVVEALLHGPAGFRKRVALKLLHPGAALDHAQVDRLIHEARVGAMLSHPNLVSTLELGEFDGVWFVSMELVPGSTLSAWLRQGPLSPAAVVEVGTQVCAALSYIHEMEESGRPLRLVHRDVKPGNLLLHPAGLVRLADFGLAGLASELAGNTSGTPGYMAPEQMNGRAESRSDLFGLGMTLLCATTGNYPLGRGVGALQATAAIERHLDRPEFLAPAESLLPGLGDVLRTSLRADPDLRFSSARQMASALRALASGAIGPSLVEQPSGSIVEWGSAAPQTEASNSPTALILEPGNRPVRGSGREGESAQEGFIDTGIRTSNTEPRWSSLHTWMSPPRSRQ